MKKTLIIEHVPFENAGIIEDFLNKHQIIYDRHKVYEKEFFPEVSHYDGAIIMGGPMSVHDSREYPFISEELKWIEDFLNQNKPICGICLGAQMIAHVLGAKITKNHHKEIGWFDVEFSDQFAEECFQKKSFTQKTFHWHGETFSIPKGAYNIGQSEACLHQGFVYRENVIGLQFHLEVKKDNVISLIKNCKDEIQNAPYIQNESDMVVNDYFEENHQLMIQILNQLF